MSKKNNQDANMLAIDKVKSIIVNVFPSDCDIKSLKSIEGSADDVKLSSGKVFYSVSVIMSKHTDENKERWMYNVLRANEETNETVWKYVHPTTKEVYDDPNMVDYKTLPFVA